MRERRTMMDKKPFRCPACGSEFQTREQLEAHRKVHETPDPSASESKSREREALTRE
jgi:hypothetical protein